MSAHVVVIGGGIIGAASAVLAQREGFRVTLLEPGQPGGEQAASFGNGCWLNPASVIPPAVPGVWRKVPRFLRDPLGPLAIRWRYFPRALPWLIRYLLSGWRWSQVEQTAQALHPLVAEAPRLHKELAASVGCGHLIEQRGLIYVYSSRAAFMAEAPAWTIRRRLGLRWVELEEEALRQYEPELDRRYRFGILIEEGGQCLDPAAYTAALIAHALSEGAQLRRERAVGFVIEGGQLKAVRIENGEEIAAERAVIAAGAFSRPLAAAAGDPVPLESERGYHAEILAAEVAPRHGLMLAEEKVALVRTLGGVRCAGQVEIAGLAAAPNWRRAEILRDHLQRSFPALPQAIPPQRLRYWLGHRPALPDGKPCLGPARASPDIVHAFGHGHIGLVAAARTARVVAALLARRPPEIAIAPFAAARFR